MKSQTDGRPGPAGTGNSGPECNSNRTGVRVAMAVEPSGPSTAAKDLPSPTRGRVALFIALGLLILAPGGWFGCKVMFPDKKPAPASVSQAPPVVTVTSVPAALALIADTKVVTGTVTAWDPLSVGAEVGGLRIKNIFCEEGDAVSKGQVLASLNSSLIDAELMQARARLRAGLAQLKKARQPNRKEDILALRAAFAHAQSNSHSEQAKLKQAKVNLTNSELNAQRYSDLAAMGATSAQEAENKNVVLETAKEEVANAEARLEAARYTAEQAHERLLQAERGGRLEDVEISRAAIAEQEAQIKHLEGQLEQTSIKAPDSGVISRREAHIGDITTQGKTLFSLIRNNRLELTARVNDMDLARFQPGQTAEISTSEISPACLVKGTVRLVSPQVDAITRQGIVRIDLPRYSTDLKPGMFVRAEVVTGRRQVLAVPVSCVVTRAGESVVFKLKDDKVTACSVTTGAQSAGVMEIVSGLSAGDAVVLKGARFLSSGDVVRLAP